MIGRPDLIVIGRLLEALAPEPLKRTQWQQRARLNYTVFQRYLDFLQQIGLVTVPQEDGRVELTSKGVEAHRFLSDGLAQIFDLPLGPRDPS
jgi:predicted transcriptional regulator